jgi:hypothetical protein
MNFGKVSRKGIGVGLSQRTLELLLYELAVWSPEQFVLPREGGEESRAVLLSWYLGLGGGAWKSGGFPSWFGATILSWK